MARFGGQKSECGFSVLSRETNLARASGYPDADVVKEVGDMPDVKVTVVGNLVADPELRFTPAGQPVCNFRVASTPRFFDKVANEWRDGETMFLAGALWRDAGEHLAASAAKGDRLIIHGSLKARSYETREGEKRTVFELDADEVGVSVKYCPAHPERKREQTPALTSV